MKSVKFPAARIHAPHLLQHRQRGSALVEYTVVVLFLIIVLVADENVIRQAVDAVREAYANFVYALSISWA